MISDYAMCNIRSNITLILSSQYTYQDMPILQNEMLQLGKCAKDNSKIFVLNRRVSKLSFGNIKFD